MYKNCSNNAVQSMQSLQTEDHDDCDAIDVVPFDLYFLCDTHWYYYYTLTQHVVKFEFEKKANWKAQHNVITKHLESEVATSI